MAQESSSNPNIADVSCYFVVGVKIFFLQREQSFVSFPDAYKEFKEFYYATSFLHENEIFVEFFREIILEFEDNGVCEVIRDEFAYPFVKFNKKFLSSAYDDGKYNEIYTKYKRLGASGVDWMASAMKRISSMVTIDVVSEYFERGEDSVNDQEIETVEDISIESDQDTWEPLPLNRDDPFFVDMLQASERALKELEASNGYAATEPEERNGIVASVRGAIDSLKSGSPSLNYLKHSLLRPLQFIAQKFSETMIGELAKAAAGKFLRWIAENAF